MRCQQKTFQMHSDGTMQAFGSIYLERKHQKITAIPTLSCSTQWLYLLIFFLQKKLKNVYVTSFQLLKQYEYSCGYTCAGRLKRHPRKKFTKPFAGKSLIAHALNCVWRSEYAADVVVSTDSLEILEHAKSLGYRGEYLRPVHLAQDESSSVDAVLDVLSWSTKNNKKI